MSAPPVRGPAGQESDSTQTTQPAAESALCVCVCFDYKMSPVVCVCVFMCTALREFWMQSNEEIKARSSNGQSLKTHTQTFIHPSLPSPPV